MSAHTAERRPLGALGRMGFVAGMHVALLLSAGTQLGVGAADPRKTVGDVIDETRAPDDPPPPPDPRLDPADRDIHWFLRMMPHSVRDDQRRVDHARRPASRSARQKTRRKRRRACPIIVNVQAGSASPAVAAAVSARRYPRRQPGHVRRRDLRAAERPRRRRTHRQEHGIRAHWTASTLDEAKRSWRLTPATRDGVPFAQWHRLRVIFKLKNQ